MNKIKIAICGTRGVPANYGGFETFAEELGSLLVSRGYEVTVFCRYYSDDKSAKIPEYKGMKCRYVKAFKHKYFETPLSTLFSFVDPIIKDVDIVLLCNAANSPFAFIPRILGKPVVINLDGIERERRKWNWIGKLWYRIGEVTSVLFGSALISDANYIQQYYKKKYKRNSSVIRYGARHLEIEFAKDKIKGNFDLISNKYSAKFTEFKLTPGKYILYVSRLEPENNADKVILAYNLLPDDLRQNFPLVIVGDAPYSEDFKKRLREIACTEVVFLGYQFGVDYILLQSGAYIYVQATEVGGTHPALVEAMGFANSIVANSVEEHHEVVEDVASFYKFNDIKDLSRILLDLLLSEDKVLENRKRAFDRAMTEYKWSSICEQYENLFRENLR